MYSSKFGAVIAPKLPFFSSSLKLKDPSPGWKKTWEYMAEHEPVLTLDLCP